MSLKKTTDRRVDLARYSALLREVGDAALTEVYFNDSFANGTDKPVYREAVRRELVKRGWL
jgi:hypothetical protein